jgi:hypothetical protein
MVVPIKPQDIKKGKVFPDKVIEAFNELILKNYHGTSAIVKQEDVVVLMLEKGLEREDIFDNNWLDVENVYRRAGWHVEYDEPGFNESYPATYIFSHKRLV